MTELSAAEVRVQAPPPAAADSPSTIPAPSRRWSGLTAADLAITLLVVLLAGFLASHVSRLSDQWLHFAAGRDLLNGRYSLGSDPYSYSAADRTWVNHSWLYDMAAYGLYSIDDSGRAVVLAKAAVFVLAVLLALSIRRGGVPRWPYWLLAMVALLAAAPFTALRPAIVSGLFVVIVLRLLIHARWQPGGWKNPILLALLCTLWANIDEWFLLGPAMIAMALLASLAQRFFPEDDPAAPRVGDLFKALLLCIAATMLNPHLFRVWQLPIGIAPGLPSTMTDDPQLVLLNLSPLQRFYINKPELGWNANGLAFAVLLLAGGGLLALGLRRVRLTCMFLWVFLAILAMAHYRLILFFALAAIPLAAAPLAAIAEQFSTWRHGRLFSPLLRVGGFAAAALLLAFAWPGWLHTQPADPAYANRVGLGVQADEGHVRTATLIRDWRASGKLPETVRGTPNTMELANHLAWFAPGERVFFNSRYTHHRPELERFLAARAALAGDDAAAAGKSIRDMNADYLALGSRTGQMIDLPMAIQLSVPGGGFRLWHLDGRTAILGDGAAAALSFDPVALAFAPDQPPLPEPVVLSAPDRRRDPYDDFFNVPKPIPLATLDARAFQNYGGFVWLNQQFEHATLLEVSTALAGPGILVSMPPPRASDEAVALNLLAQRSARIAIATNPDHPQAYFTLGHALSPNEYPLPGANANDMLLPRATNMRRYLDRMPPPKELRRWQEAQQCEYAANALIEYYQRVGMADLMFEAHRLRIEYGRQERGGRRLEPEQMKAAMEQLDAELEQVNQQYSRLLGEFEVEYGGAPANVRLGQAMQRQLAGEALKILRTADLDKEFGVQARGVELQGVGLRLQAGLLEEAVQALNTLDQKLKQPVSDPQQQAINDQVRQQIVPLWRSISGLSGDFSAVRDELNAAATETLPDDLRDRLRAGLVSPEAMQAWLGGHTDGALGGAPGLGLGQAMAVETLKYWRLRADIQRRLGLTWLFDGKMKEARESFERSLNIDGVPMPVFLGEHGIAAQYLRMIDAAAKPR